MGGTIQKSHFRACFLELFLQLLLTAAVLGHDHWETDSQEEEAYWEELLVAAQCGMRKTRLNRGRNSNTVARKAETNPFQSGLALHRCFK